MYAWITAKKIKPSIDKNIKKRVQAIILVKRLEETNSINIRTFYEIVQLVIRVHKTWRKDFIE